MAENREPTSDTVAERDLLKGLARLENLAKAQITAKLPGNQGPKGSWAYGEEPTEVSDEDSDVSSDSGEEERGGKKSDTDYKPKPSPVRKGMDAESGKDDDQDGDEDPEEDDDAGEDDDGDQADAGEGDADEGDKETEKSFAARARASRSIRRGVEVSPFLRDLVGILEKSFSDLERGHRRELRSQLRGAFARQHKFNKSLADALSNLGAVSLAQGDLIKALSAQPARGLKSQTSAVRPVHKSFDGPGDDQISLPDGTTAPQLSKAVVLERLLNGVAKNLIPATEVVKFETTGIVQPALYKALVSDERYAK